MCVRTCERDVCEREMCECMCVHESVCVRDVCM